VHACGLRTAHAGDLVEAHAPLPFQPAHAVLVERDRGQLERLEIHARNCDVSHRFGVEVRAGHADLGRGPDVVEVGLERRFLAETLAVAVCHVAAHVDGVAGGRRKRRVQAHVARGVVVVAFGPGKLDRRSDRDRLLQVLELDRVGEHERDSAARGAATTWRVVAAGELVERERPIRVVLHALGLACGQRAFCSLERGIDHEVDLGGERKRFLGRELGELGILRIGPRDVEGEFLCALGSRGLQLDGARDLGGFDRLVELEPESRRGDEVILVVAGNGAHELGARGAERQLVGLREGGAVHGARAGRDLDLEPGGARKVLCRGEEHGVGADPAPFSGDLGLEEDGRLGFGASQVEGTHGAVEDEVDFCGLANLALGRAEDDAEGFLRGDQRGVLGAGREGGARGDRRRLRAMEAARSQGQEGEKEGGSVSGHGGWSLGSKACARGNPAILRRNQGPCDHGGAGLRTRRRG